MSKEELADYNGIWQRLVLRCHCSKAGAELSFLDICFSKNGGVLLEDKCLVCGKEDEHVIIGDCGARDGYYTVILRCENCRGKLQFLNICFSAQDNMLLEYRCIACGEDGSKIFSRRDRIQLAFVIGGLEEVAEHAPPISVGSEKRASVKLPKSLLV